MRSGEPISHVQHTKMEIICERRNRNAARSKEGTIMGKHCRMCSWQLGIIVKENYAMMEKGKGNMNFGVEAE